MQSAGLLVKCSSNGFAHYSTFNLLSRIKDVRKWQKLYQKSFVALMSSGRDPKNPNFTPMLHPTAEEYSSLDPEKKRKLVEMEIKIQREFGRFDVPAQPIADQHWKELLARKSVSSRRKYFKYLKQIEIYKEIKLQKKLEGQKKWEEEKEARASNPHLIYALCRNTIFRRISRQTMLRHYDNNLRHAVLYGQDIVLDMDYGSVMTNQEMNACVRQLQFMNRANTTNVDPFHIHFCNMPPTDSQMYCKTVLGNPRWKKSGLTEVTSKSYLEIFPKNRLVYLTQDCRQDLVKFNHDDVYIIGCEVELGPSKLHVLAKAKREGLRMARLPVERYVSFSGNKSLTLNHIFKILLTVKNTGDWEKALKQHIPSRKIRQIMEVKTGKTDTKDKKQSSRYKAKFDAWDLVNDLLKDS